MGSTRKHVDFKEIYLYKDEMDEAAWEVLLNKLGIHEPATTVCLTVSHVESFIEEYI
jgi:hypothetical protein